MNEVRYGCGFQTLRQRAPTHRGELSYGIRSNNRQCSAELMQFDTFLTMDTTLAERWSGLTRR